MSFFTQSHTTYSSKDQCILTPNTGTNTDTVVETLGTGALLRNIPDGSSTGGNARGDYATDLQRDRTAAANVASGTHSGLGGGVDNQATSDYAIVGGGQQNSSASTNCSIIGGANNITSANCATVGGGHNNKSQSDMSFVGGGENNYIKVDYAYSSTYYSVICGGFNNLINNASGGNGADHSVICGGYYNSIYDNYCFIGGGYQNTINNSGSGGTASCHSSIVGGYQNTIGSGSTGNDNNVIGGGQTNSIASGTSVSNSVITGGTSNVIGSSSGSTALNSCCIDGGYNNSINGVSSGDASYSFIGGGDSNNISAKHCGILAGAHLSLTQEYTAACGQYNTPGNISGGGNSGPRIFMVGYGASGSTKNLMSVVNYTSGLSGGYVVVDAGYLTSAGADFGEMYESASGEAIPVGTPVVFQPGTNKIIPATNGYFSQVPIGVISNTCMCIGNTAAEYWHDRYERDADGNIIMIDSFDEHKKIEYKMVDEEVEEEIYDDVEETVYKVVADKNSKVYRRVEEKVKIRRPITEEWNVVDENGAIIGTRKIPRTFIRKTQKRVPVEVIEKIPIRIQKENPLYRKDEKYITRLDRKEWNIVGFLGKVKVLKGSPVASNWVKIESPTDSKYDIYFIK